MDKRADFVRHVHPTTGATDGDRLTDYQRAPEPRRASFRSASTPGRASGSHVRGGRFDGVKAIPITRVVARPDGVFAELGDPTTDTGRPIAAGRLEPESAPDVEAEFWDTGERAPLRHRGLLGFRWGGNRGREHDEQRDEIIGLIEAEAIEAARGSAREPVSTGH